MAAAQTQDFLIIGGGVMGVAMARTLLQRDPSLRVLLIEKESTLGQHASGRNSGVLHAGFYYSPDSLKARFTRQGNKFWRDFATEQNIPINICGKLVVPTNENELEGLRELFRRGQVNGVDLQWIDEAAAHEIEPRAVVYQNAIWSPTTAVIDIKCALAKLWQEAEHLGAKALCGVRAETLTLQTNSNSVSVRAPNGQWEAKHVINCAGLYADSLAQQVGFSQHYRILPFKGLYLYGDESEHLSTHIYPVPDPAFPFLGVHFTVTVDGHVKMGPTAIPAFWRENYSGWDRFNAAEMMQILGDEARLFATNKFNFRKLALREMPKFFRTPMVRDGARLIKGVSAARYKKWGKPGIRAQLTDTRSMKLEMDFVVEGDHRTTHILNSVSPAWTCALPFAQHVVDGILGPVKARLSVSELSSTI